MHDTHRFTGSKLGRGTSAALTALLLGLFAVTPSPVQAETPGTVRLAQAQQRGDEYLPPWQRNDRNAAPQSDADQPQQIRPPARGGYSPPPTNNGANVYDSSGAGRGDLPAQGQSTYVPPPRDTNAPPPPSASYEDNTYSTSEIVNAGHRFFGGVTKGLGKAVEYTFQKQGRPNGYILGDEGGGALFAGLRYGEGTLYTKNAGIHRVYWQGPSLGYDVGGEGSKTLILVYNLRDVSQIYNRFAGVDGSAYLVGGVGVTFQTYDDVVLAPIRSGVGLRLGANVGYLKYTRTPTWNPF